jgi:hypothetical protein
VEEEEETSDEEAMSVDGWVMSILVIPDGWFLYDFSVIMKKVQLRVGNYDCLVTSDDQKWMASF